MLDIARSKLVRKGRKGSVRRNKLCCDAGLIACSDAFERKQHLQTIFSCIIDIGTSRNIETHGKQGSSVHSGQDRECTSFRARDIRLQSHFDCNSSNVQTAYFMKARDFPVNRFPTRYIGWTTRFVSSVHSQIFRATWIFRSLKGNVQVCRKFRE